MTKKLLLNNTAILNLLTIIRVSNSESFQKINNHIIICSWKRNCQTIEKIILNSILTISIIKRRYATSRTMFNRTQKPIQIVKNRIWVDWLFFQPQFFRICGKCSLLFYTIFFPQILIQHINKAHLHLTTSLHINEKLNGIMLLHCFEGWTPFIKCYLQWVKVDCPITTSPQKLHQWDVVRYNTFVYSLLLFSHFLTFKLSQHKYSNYWIPRDEIQCYIRDMW